MKKKFLKKMTILSLLISVAFAGERQSIPDCAFEKVDILGSEGFSGFEIAEVKQLSISFVRPLKDKKKRAAAIEALRSRYPVGQLKFHCARKESRMVTLSQRDADNAAANLQRTLVEARLTEVVLDSGRRAVKMYGVHSQGYFRELELLEGDILLALNEKPVLEKGTVLRQLVTTLAKGNVVQLKVQRDDREIDFHYSFDG